MKRTLYVHVLSMIGFLLLTMQSNATEAYPSNWFVNMKYNQIQVLFRSVDADFSKASIAVNYPGVKVQKIHHFENGHYIRPVLMPPSVRSFTRCRKRLSNRT